MRPVGDLPSVKSVLFISFTIWLHDRKGVKNPWHLTYSQKFCCRTAGLEKMTGNQPTQAQCENDHYRNVVAENTRGYYQLDKLKV